MHAALDYRPSGRVDLARFPLLAMVPLALAAAFAVLLDLAWRHGFYPVTVLAILSAMAVSATLLVSLRQGHCRSRAVAVSTGLSAAVLLYGGFLALGMWKEFESTDPARFGEYMVWRMEHQVIEGYLVRPTTPDEPVVDSFEEGMNWFLLVLELVAVLGLLVPPAWLRVHGEPFCEPCGAWMRRHRLAFPPDSGLQVAGALRKGTFAELAAQYGTPPRPGRAALLAAIDHCPLRRGCRGGVPAYVSLIDVGENRAFVDPFHPLHVIVRCRVRGLPLSHPQLDLLTPQLTADEIDLEPRPEPSSVEEDPSEGGPWAEIRSLGVPPERQVVSRRNAWISNALTLSWLVFFFGALGLIYLGLETSAAQGSVFLVVGAALEVLLLILGIRDGAFLGRVFMEWKLRRHIEARSDRLVHPSNPEALSVEVVPRRHWGKFMLENATDMGYLALDPVRRELRFEGDRERYRVPLAAIVGFELDGYKVGEGLGAGFHPFVVLHVRTAKGVVVLPLIRRYASLWEVLRWGWTGCARDFQKRVMEFLSPGRAH